MKNKWTVQWPKQEGFYWFYGCPFGTGTKELGVLKVIQCGNFNNFNKVSFVYIYNGHFLYKEEGTIGKFCPLETPKDLPDFLG